MERADAEELLRTLFSDPEESRRRAEAELVPDPDPAVASIGHQVAAIVLRDVGRTDDALAHLKHALRLAKGVDGDREADVRATLGSTLVHVGRTRAGLAELDRATAGLEGVPLARVLVRRARVRAFYFAELEASLHDLRRAVAILEDSGDEIWLARALNLVGWTSAGLGDLVAARRAFDDSLAIHEALGQQSAAAINVHNHGWLAYLEGDLPRALELYADADARFDAVGVTSPELVYDRCTAYLAGGLASDALGVVERALVARPLLAVERADLLIALAGAALDAGDTDRARSAADEASRLLRGQGRRREWVAAELLAVTARRGATDRPGRLLARMEEVVDAAREAGAPELPQALLVGAGLAARVSSDRARGLGDRWLEEAAANRLAPLGTTRALGWLARARQGAAVGDTSAVLRACERGLTALDHHRATLGSQELRARTSVHGSDLAELGTRTALASGDARQLLRWAERWRATTIAVPAARAGHDPDTSTDLAALRALHQRLAEAHAAGEPTDRLQARVTRLEQSVRQRLLHARGAEQSAQGVDVGALLAALAADDTVLVELTEVDGVLHALVAGRGRVRHRVGGDAAAASRAVDFSLFTLRQAARGRRAQVDVAGRRLQDALLGHALDGVGDARFVVSPTTALQGVPWGVLPDLADRPFTTAPSARLWLRARSAAPHGDRRVMVVGPGLGSGGAEVPVIAADDPSAEVLDGDDATAAATLAALDGASLAHVAAHGRFREDSPLFSSLSLADGPLLVHDLQQLRHPPHRVVLSACESGVLAPVGDQELLGLSAALLSMGTAGVVSALAEVDDAATVEVMVALHTALRKGVGLGEALHAARSAAGTDPVLTATAASFTAMGT
ncbi:CHAT domain-containing protein [Nocardioides okcheonensis]|uniref:CHAT domain-containing protein n=1 Tax=Nocardioides okcheonensis TaxID=2894081 RepID=UPI001E2B1836|nr:CHAT domain-containing protein [Nocardioides okcheonensis]UFN45685.1 CHAT domain-containing protein [Nocardioides okcheonensis]